MDALTLFGLVAVTSMLVFYTFEQRSPWCIVGFAIGVWTVVALLRWRRVATSG